ncbi:aminotransferase class III-fold pyridoxal phosphate-dependent enzyme [Sinorhizobium sp. 7-81]|uniref:class-III pyridoxal-phosphate-dependent aminotransferase n=1 Tax=Sinorhizobium sp. 8-89 TaxID=3049089 RepID=UPI0024C3A5BF|nr:aminotransferase class III-fold pyridoxal phosphate-dependent enzyme [Sinorhizobium sp. 8-89]MDK1494771.1 aminotransferase class III-fold pyridoxal phosphate-dependent enzyme [Sinorhizobium sp. 8-89]
MFDYGMFKFSSKEEVFETSERYWNPGKTRFWRDAGIDLVIDRREGYELFDMDGRRLIDLHINGGTFNFGHRNPEIVDTLKTALDHFDIGNHWFPSMARAALAEALVKVSPGFDHAFFSPGGAEAIDVAIKSARYATGRRKIVSIVKGYHGHSGLSVATGDARFSKIFLSDRPEEFLQVPFNDLDAMEQALSSRDVAAVIIETIPATYGFPMPDHGYNRAVKELCERYGALYIADEVQTGLLRTGQMWGWQTFGVQPDIFVSAKGIGGGVYPFAVTMLTKRSGAWMEEDGAAHISTSGGSEVGCFVALKVLEILSRPEVVANVEFLTGYFADAFAEMIRNNDEVLAGIRQKGVVIGLEFRHPEGAVHASRALYEHGVWAIFSSLDSRVLQFKPGVLMSEALASEVIHRFYAALPRIRELNAQAPAIASPA